MTPSFPFFAKYYPHIDNTPIIANCQYAANFLFFNYENPPRMVYVRIRYDPLWETMKKRGVSQYKLLKDYHFSAGQLSRLRQNENVSTYTLNTLCKILDCTLEEVAVYLPDEPDGEKRTD